ncbi:exocyst complex component 3-like protein 4 [Cololabis saira]|uniref:exocyst complex component 3-like protein 4 n=1 Tax=Cololabis saira TaxID=129043 RepID=UPI002AD4669B|nr:exocyst complex component 3-like protein 4 [Cololabis saira]
MDKSSENPDGDSVSLRSNENTPTNSTEKQPKRGMLKTFRSSFQRAAERSPLLARRSDPKVTPRAEAGSSSPWSGPAPPPSPSLSAGSPATSPLGLLPRTEEDQVDGAGKGKGLARSKTDPNMSKLGESLMKKGASLRRSLRFPSKKDSNRARRQEPVQAVSQNSVEKVEETKEEEEEEEEEEQEEIEELYALPELPDTPLSVMQINNLIEMEVLEEAHLNLLAMRREFKQEREQFLQDSPVELAKKEKDLNLLYGVLRKKINTIVRDSNSLPARNKGLLVPVARIIQEEEQRAGEPGGLQDSWIEAWREAVGEGVQVKVTSVHLEQKEHNPSWLAVHLGLLGKAIVEDLENVKRELRWSYPRSFKVFSTYVKSYHRVVGQHVKKLERQALERKDLYALLDWILNRYKSERIMGTLSLQTDMADESTDLQLDSGFLEQLRQKYTCRIKEDMKATLGRIIELENETVWMADKLPEKDDDSYSSPFPMDIWTNVKGNVQHAKSLGAELEQNVISSCLEELKHFPKRFESEFRRHCFAAQPHAHWTEYQITYINSFTALQQHMETYQDSRPGEVEAFRKEVKWLVVTLMQGLEEQFKEDVKPYLRRMMTRKWLTKDGDFVQLQKRTGLLSEHCRLMRDPHGEEFASRLHHHIAREYIGQLMKNNYTCKNVKHERAAAKIRHQWTQLSDLFLDMRTAHDWLHPVGDHLSDIIGQKNKADIKNHLQPLVEHYPDFSKKHLAAVLYFRGLLRGRERQLILQRLTELKKRGVGSERSGEGLFRDMQVTDNTDCLSNLPFSCLNFLLPDS